MSVLPPPSWCSTPSPRSLLTSSPEEAGERLLPPPPRPPCPPSVVCPFFAGPGHPRTIVHGFPRQQNSANKAYLCEIWKAGRRRKPCFSPLQQQTCRLNVGVHSPHQSGLGPWGCSDPSSGFPKFPD
ncbi:retinoic acid receptor beta-like isoform X2 [Lynx rufus]|uniref:retinoic acid receptor beta-like isoform X2 n=1 Tax=Lynx rufus TaxID=61384 RepID=UPI001F12298E|nr:retinoic acid receptor beta-like isoform X2 [Lynx rufus]